MSYQNIEQVLFCKIFLLIPKLSLCFNVPQIFPLLQYRDWGDTWLTRSKYGIYVAVRGSYGALTGSTWCLLSRKISPIYCRVSYVAVTRIPSLVLRNTWHYVIIRYSYGNFLNLSYVAHTRRLYAKVWPRHKDLMPSLDAYSCVACFPSN